MVNGEARWAVVCLEDAPLSYVEDGVAKFAVQKPALRVVRARDYLHKPFGLDVIASGTFRACLAALRLLKEFE